MIINDVIVGIGEIIRVVEVLVALWFWLAVTLDELEGDGSRILNIMSQQLEALEDDGLYIAREGIVALLRSIYDH